MTVIDPYKIVIAPEMPPFSIWAIADVSAPSWPKQQGKYVVYTEAPAENEAWVIMAIGVCAGARTNVGQSVEGMQWIDPKNGNGFFLFEPQVSGKAAWGLSKIYQAGWTTAAGATNADIKTANGITVLSAYPFESPEKQTGNGVRRFLVPPGQPLTVLFSLIPDAIANAMPQRYAVGGTTALSDPLLRVDFAACYMTGVKLSRAYYDELKKQAERMSKG